MKKTLVVAVALVASLAQAQNAPGTINFNALLTDTSGMPITGARAMTFRIFPAATGGAAAWSENVASVTFSATGVASVELGAMTALTPTIFDGSRLFLEIQVDSTTLTPRIPLVSVPYAIRASAANTATTATNATNATTAATALTLGTLAPGDVQVRVTGNCPSGQAIRAVAADGTVTCQALTASTTGPGLVYRRLLTPRFLDANATFGVARGRNVTDTQLNILAGTVLDERIFTYPLIPAGTLDPTRAHLFRIRVDRVAPGLVDNDPTFGITDGTRFIGINKIDQSAVGSQVRVSTEGTTLAAGTTTSLNTGNTNPDNFEILMHVDPTATAGSYTVFFVMRDGSATGQHQTVTTFNPANAISLSVYANTAAETYQFVTFDVTIEREN